MGRCLRSIGVVVCVVWLLMSATAHASFHIVSDSVECNCENRTTTFDVRFDHPPDFVDVDSAGRQQDSFQYFFESNPRRDLFDMTPGVAIIRGEEIHVADALRIRAAAGDDPSDSSGGWGPVRATVPFTVEDESVHFAVGWDTLGQTGDHFRYALQTYEFGTLNDTTGGMIPLPQAFWAGGGTLLIVVITQIVLSRHRPT